MLSIYTQYPRMNRIVELAKTSVFRHFMLSSLGASSAAVTAYTVGPYSLLFSDANSFAHLDLEILSHSFFFADPLSSVRLDGAILRCLGSFSVVSATTNVCCVFRVIILLEWDPSAQSEVLATVDQLIHDIHLSFNPHQSVPAAQCCPHQAALQGWN